MNLDFCMSILFLTLHLLRDSCKRFFCCVRRCIGLNQWISVNNHICSSPQIATESEQQQDVCLPLAIFNSYPLPEPCSTGRTTLNSGLQDSIQEAKCWLWILAAHVFYIGSYYLFPLLLTLISIAALEDDDTEVH